MRTQRIILAPLTLLPLLAGLIVVLNLVVYGEANSLISLTGWLFVAIVSVAIGLLAIITTTIKRQHVFIGRPVLLIFCSYMLYIAIQIPGTILYSVYDKYTFMFLYTILLFALGYTIFTVSKPNLHKFLLVVLVLHTTLLLADLAYFHLSASSFWGRAAGTLRNPNPAGFLAVACAAGAFSLSGKHKTTWNIIVLGVASLGIAATASAGAAAALLFVIAGVTVWWLRDERSLKRIIFRGSLIFTLAPVVAMLVWYGIWYFKAQAAGVTGSGNIESFFLNTLHSQRLLVLYKGYQYSLQSPLFGHGLGGVYRMTGLGPHVMAIRAAIQGGIFGFIAFFGFWAVMLGLFYRRRWFNSFIFSCGMVGMSLTTHNLAENRNVILMLGLVVAADSYRLRKTHSSQLGSVGV